MMPNFTDIARLSRTLSDNGCIFVNSDNTLEVSESKQKNREISVRSETGGHRLTWAECLDALAQSAGEEFVNDLRRQLDIQTPLCARDIRSLADRSAAKIESRAHLRNLEYGLLAKGSSALDLPAVVNLIEKIRGRPEFSNCLADETIKQFLADITASQNDIVKARSDLKNIDYSKFNGEKVAAKLEAYAAAQGDFSVGVTDFTNLVRDWLRAHGDIDDENLRGITEDLYSLDDQMEIAARDTAQVEALADTMRLLKISAPPPDLAESISRLVEAQKAVSPDVLASAQDKIKDFSEKFEQLFSVIAGIDNASAEERLLDDGSQPMTAASRLEALTAALQAARDGLASLDDQPGIDQKALKAFQENFQKIEDRAQTLLDGVGEKFVEDAILALAESRINAAKLALKLKQHRSDTETRKALGDLSDSLNKQSQQLNECLKNRSHDETLIETLKNESSPLRVCLDEICEYTENWERRQCEHDNIKSVRFFDLNRFNVRVKKLMAVVEGNSITSPVSVINSQLLGDVVRGELDILNYLELRQSDLPQEMLRTELIPKLTDGKSTHSAAGAMHTVEFVPVNNTRQGTEVEYAIKKFEASDTDIATSSIGRCFSQFDHARNTAKLNYASKLSAELIGCGAQITSCGIVRYQNQYVLAQEKAAGDSLLSVIRCEDKALIMLDKNGASTAMSLPDGLNQLDEPDRARAMISLHCELAKLEWADWLSGQLDRHENNLLVNVRVETAPDGKKRIFSEVKGIDNDTSFPEGRPGLTKFSLVEKKAPTDKDAYDMDNLEDAKYLTKLGMKSARMPSFLPRSVKNRIESLSNEDFRKQMEPYLSEAAVKSAISRLEEMKARVSDYEKYGRIIEDTDNFTDEAAMKRADELNVVAKNDYKRYYDKFCMGRIKSVAYARRGLFGQLLATCPGFMDMDFIDPS